MNNAQQLHEQAQTHLHDAIVILKNKLHLSQPNAELLVHSIAGYVMADYASRLNGWEDHVFTPEVVQ